MRIKLIAVGTKMPTWVTTGYQEYAKRLPRDCSLELVELPLGHRGKGADLSRAILKEGDAMLAAIPANDQVVAMEVGGKELSTEALAKQLETWQMSGDHLSILVGGPDGLDKRCVERAKMKWSLSPLTLPHPLVRVILAEQLYRAWSILQGHPYHK